MTLKRKERNIFRYNVRMPYDREGHHISSISGQRTGGYASSGGGPSASCRTGECGGTCRNGISSTQENTRPTVNPASLSNTDDKPYSEVIWTTDEAKDRIAVLMRYPSVEKRNGFKLAVFDRPVWNRVDKKKLDLHFYDDKNSPIARFNVNEQGLELALNLASPNSVGVDKAVMLRLMKLRGL